MGGFEAGTPVLVEPTLKYHPGVFEVLTQARYPGRGQCVVGSLTGAVSSQRVTEEHEGWLSTVGHFFKQKTAYEIDTCDWSSDVCSSDLFDWGGLLPKSNGGARRWANHGWTS